MKHRIFVPQLETSGDIVVSGEEFHHAVRAVRLREGEAVELFDGRGRATAGRVTAIGKGELHVAVDAEIASREMRLRVTLAMAIIQLDKFELVLQKATELGVHMVIPLITDRVELRAERYRGRHDRWEKILFEAVKQSGRASLPVLNEPLLFDDALKAGGTLVIFDADTEPSPQSATAAATTLFIGPEGGWSERELQLARTAGCLFRRLGPRRLRAETAALVALATTAAEAGELG